jgi:MSHA biogenesis protein MshK
MKMRIFFSLPLLLLLAEASAVDPTRPPTPAEIAAWLRGEQVEASAAPTVFQLQSVLLSDQRRIAVINGQRLSVGDEVDGARVKEINAGRVVLEHNGEHLFLSISVRSHGDMDRE